MEQVNANNQHSSLLESLDAITKNEGQVFEKMIARLPPYLLEQLSDKWYGSDNTKVERLVDELWVFLDESFYMINKAEEDAKKARKVITAVLSREYLKAFPKNFTQCDHDAFQKLIDDRYAEVSKEMEIQRRVQEHLAKQQVSANVNMNDDADLRCFVPETPLGRLVARHTLPFLKACLAFPNFRCVRCEGSF